MTESSPVETPFDEPLRSARRDRERPLSYADLRRFAILAIGVVAGAFFLQRTASVLLLFAVVFLAAAALNPLVAGLERRKVRRGLAVILVVLGLGVVFAGLVALVVPPIIEQTTQLVQKAPDVAKNVQVQADQLGERIPRLKPFIEQIQSLNLPKEAQKRAGQIDARAVLANLTGIVGGIIGGIFLTLVALLMLVFTLSNPTPLISGLLRATPPQHRDAMNRTVQRFLAQMGAWIKATLINGLITGVSTGVGLYFVGVPNALVFGVLAAFGEFVPNIGPVVAAAPALFVALSQGPTTFALACLVILVVQQVESNLLVPFIMGRSLELHPVTIIFFALTMGALFGVTGAILAVPIAVLVKIVWDEWVLRPRGDLNEGDDPDAIDERAGEIIVGQRANASEEVTAKA